MPSKCGANAAHGFDHVLGTERRLGIKRDDVHDHLVSLTVFAHVERLAGRSRCGPWCATLRAGNYHARFPPRLPGWPAEWRKASSRAPAQIPGLPPISRQARALRCASSGVPSSNTTVNCRLPPKLTRGRGRYRARNPGVCFHPRKHCPDGRRTWLRHSAGPEPQTKKRSQRPCARMASNTGATWGWTNSANCSGPIWLVIGSTTATMSPAGFHVISRHGLASLAAESHQLADLSGVSNIFMKNVRAQQVHGEGERAGDQSVERQIRMRGAHAPADLQRQRNPAGVGRRHG